VIVRRLLMVGALWLVVLRLAPGATGAEADAATRDAENALETLFSAVTHYRGKASIDSARQALELGADINARDEAGRTVLWRVVRRGFDSEIWNFLVDNGAHVWIADDVGFTVIDWAAILSSDNIGCPRVPPDLSAKAAAGNIHTAAIHGDARRIQEFLDRGVSVNARHPRDRKTPLHWAVFMGHTDAVKLLLERRADVNAREDNGNTPLHHACWRRGKIHPVGPELLYLLLEYGADAAARNRKGETPQDYVPSWHPFLLRAARPD